MKNGTNKSNVARVERERDQQIERYSPRYRRRVCIMPTRSRSVEEIEVIHVNLARSYISLFNRRIRLRAFAVQREILYRGRQRSIGTRSAQINVKHAGKRSPYDFWILRHFRRAEEARRTCTAPSDKSSHCFSLFVFFFLFSFLLCYR